jgi:threonyl-tRNA synthetase
MINVKLREDVKQYPENISLSEIADDIGISKKACGAMVNGKVMDLRDKLNTDCEVEILTFDSEEGKKIYWHTTAHIMAQAIKRLYPDTQFAIGPAIDTGFYYDMEFTTPIALDNIPAIENEINNIIKENIPIDRFYLSEDDSLSLMQNQTYKEELIKEHGSDNEKLSFYNRVIIRIFAQVLIL